MPRWCHAKELSRQSSELLAGGEAGRSRRIRRAVATAAAIRAARPASRISVGSMIVTPSVRRGRRVGARRWLGEQGQRDGAGAELGTWQIVCAQCRYLPPVALLTRFAKLLPYWLHAAERGRLAMPGLSRPSSSGWSARCSGSTAATSGCRRSTSRSCPRTRPASRTSAGFTVTAEHGLERAARGRPDLRPGRPRPTGRRARRSIEMLQDDRRARGRVMSVCSGAFTLAAAGLLDGRRCTTHWSHVDELRDGITRRADVDPRCPVRRRRSGDHQRGYCRRHRRLTAPGPQRARHGGGQQHRATNGGPASSRGWSGPVHRATRARERLRDARTPCSTG